MVESATRRNLIASTTSTSKSRSASNSVGGGTYSSDASHSSDSSESDSSSSRSSSSSSGRSRLKKSQDEATANLHRHRRQGSGEDQGLPVGKRGAQAKALAPGSAKAERNPARAGPSNEASSKHVPCPPPEPRHTKARRPAPPSTLVLDRTKQFDAEAERLQREFAKVRERQTATVQKLKREDKLHEELLEARRQRKIRQERILVATQRVQALCRSAWVRKAVLPHVIEERSERMRLQERQKLSRNLVEMQHMMHDIAFLEEHRSLAAVRIQAWWRKLLACRLVRVLAVRARIDSVHANLIRSAVRMQSIARGYNARKEVQVLKAFKAAQHMQKLLEEFQMKMWLLVKCQAWIRGARARREVKLKKQQHKKGRQTTYSMQHFHRRTKEVRKNSKPENELRVNSKSVPMRSSHRSSKTEKDEGRVLPPLSSKPAAGLSP